MANCCPGTQERGNTMRLKGVNYDVGRVLQGHLMRETFDVKIVHRELEIIKNDLHCNAVKIQGLDIDRVMAAAEDALEQGLEVWIAPEMFEKSQEETFDYTVKAAAAAETLRQHCPERVVLSIGTELTLFMQGIIPGDTLMERIGGPALRESIRTGTHNNVLNAFLARTNSAVRQVFHGKVTYASVVHIERVDWSIFDYVCIDHYRHKLFRDSYGDQARAFLAFGKPVVIGEFGCCTFKGAEDMGGMGWNIVDWTKMPPQLKGDYEYDQGTQARELAEELRILDEAGVDGVFVFTFVQPAIETKDPAMMKMIEGLKFDPDITSYSLVKSYADKHGTTYPDMLWDPKESFKTVADYYAEHQTKGADLSAMSHSTSIFDAGKGYGDITDLAALTDCTVVKREDRWWMFASGFGTTSREINLFSASLPEAAPLSATGWQITADTNDASKAAPFAGKSASRWWDGKGGQTLPLVRQGLGPGERRVGRAHLLRRCGAGSLWAIQHRLRRIGRHPMDRSVLSRLHSERILGAR
jgi:hypothetical protein